MRPEIREFVKIVAEVLPVAEPVFEFGSLQVRERKDDDLRELFPGVEYVGCDMREGRGVDRILDLHKIDLEDETAGTVLLLDTLEHVEYCRMAVGECFRILKPGGILIVSSVMDFPVHGYPDDYWRFTPSAFVSLLKEFDTAVVDCAGNPSHPRTVVGIGAKCRLDENVLSSLTKKLCEWRNRWLSSSQKKRKLLYRLSHLLLPPIFHRSIRNRRRRESEIKTAKPLIVFRQEQ